MNNLLKVLEFNALGKTRSRAHIFNGVKKAAHCTFSVDLDLRVDRPSSNGLLRDSAVKHSLSKVIFSTFLSKPVHASASPFEGLAERMNWLGKECAEDNFGQAMVAGGISAETINAWSVDPQVKVGEGAMGSLFDAVEDMS